MRSLMSILLMTFALFLFAAESDGLLFYCSFDRGVDADYAAGDAKCKVFGPPSQLFVPGIKGNGVHIGFDAAKKTLFQLRYNALKNVNYRQGSICFWMKPENWQSDSRKYCHFIAARNAPKKRQLMVYKYDGASLYFLIGEKSNSIARANVSRLEAGQWTHVAAVWDESGQKLYLNGRLTELTGRGEITPDMIFDQLLLGYRGWDVEDGISVMDELRIYDRPLSETEIAADFNRHAETGAAGRTTFSLGVGRGTPQTDGVIASGEYPFSGTGFFDNTGFISTRPIRWHLAHDDNFLYVALTTPQNIPPRSSQTGRDGPVWEDDSIEVWLKDSGGAVYQLVFNARGTLYDAKLDKTGKKWDMEGFRIANRVGNGVWNFETAIPLTKIGQGPWQINLCRTFKSGEQSEFTCSAPVRKAFGYSDTVNFMRLNLLPETKRFDLVSVGDINHGKLALQLEAAVPARISVSTPTREWFSECLVPENSKISFTRDFPAGGTLDIEVPGFFRGSYSGRQETPVEVRYIYTDTGARQLRTVAGNPSGTNAGKLLLTLTERNNGQVFSREVPISGKSAQLIDSWDISAIPPGDYEFCGVYARPDGKKGKPFHQLYRKPSLPPPWENNGIGIYPGKVPAPWLPLQTTKTSVAMLKQKYSFDEHLLPTSIVSAGGELLARPCELRIDGKAVSGQIERIKSTPDIAEFFGTGRSGNIEIRCHVRAEYDGMLWFTLEFEGKNARIGRLTMDIPLQKEVAEQYHNCPGNDMKSELDYPGVLYNVVWHKNLYTRPAFWIGCDERGLAWYAETLKGWRLADKENGAQLKIIGNEALLRLNMIDTPLLLNGTRRIEFALHATPVRSPNPEIRTARLMREWGFGNPTFYWNYLDNANEFFNREELKRYRNYYRKTNPEQEPRFFFYLGTNGCSPYCPEWGWFGNLWTTRPLGNYVNEVTVITSEAVRNRVTWTHACLNGKSFRDYSLWRFAKAESNPEWGLHDIYCDLTGPLLCSRAEHGCSWTDDDGILHPTLTVLGNREYQKRLYHYMKIHHPDGMILLHVTGQPAVVGVTSFCDGLVEGECFFNNQLPEQESYFDLFTPEMFRTAYWGDKWGMPVIYLPQFYRAALMVRPERAKLWKDAPTPAMMLANRHFMGYALVHDVSIWIKNAPFEQVFDRIWNKRKEFLGGWDMNVRFIPYWKTGKPFSIEASSPRVMASAYVRGKCSALIVMNDTDSTQQVLISYPGMSSVEGEDGRVKPISGGCFKATLSRRDFQVFYLKNR